jgi:hypothetical protein
MSIPVGKLALLEHWIREQFQIDWHQQRVICPQGQQSNAWYLNQDAKGESIVQIFFPNRSVKRALYEKNAPMHRRRDEV